MWGAIFSFLKIYDSMCDPCTHVAATTYVQSRRVCTLSVSPQPIVKTMRNARNRRRTAFRASCPSCSTTVASHAAPATTQKPSMRWPIRNSEWSYGLAKSRVNGRPYLTPRWRPCPLAHSPPHTTPMHGPSRCLLEARGHLHGSTLCTSSRPASHLRGRRAYHPTRREREGHGIPLGGYARAQPLTSGCAPCPRRPCPS